MILVYSLIGSLSLNDALPILRYLAQFGSSVIVERVRAGRARAKAQCTRVGRPPIPAATRRRIEVLWQEGRSINGIAKELKIAYGTAWNYVAAVRPA
jgi:molybdenum-dependent DNA-binding transcriptional regulator ModE